MIVCLLLQTAEWLSTVDVDCLPGIERIFHSPSQKLPHLQSNAARITYNVAQNVTQKFISMISNKIIHQLNKTRNGFSFKIEVKVSSHVSSLCDLFCLNTDSYSREITTDYNYLVNYSPFLSKSSLGTYQEKTNPARQRSLPCDVSLEAPPGFVYKFSLKSFEINTNCRVILA